MLSETYDYKNGMERLWKNSLYYTRVFKFIKLYENHVINTMLQEGCPVLYEIFAPKKFEIVT